MKAHASESGQMHLGICSQVTKYVRTCNHSKQSEESHCRGPVIERRHRKSVLRVKGQMYCTVCTTPCNLVRSLKKKMHRVSAQGFKQAAANFFVAKVQISTSESGPCTSIYVSTLEIAGNGPKCVRCVQNTRNFSKQPEESRCRG